ncbi:MAG: hypothetical protein GF329_06430 [Candidatus Lokiarchaeota archaeon]|nr:hypothetical protein [Candidatus Lokiarchaeota archaeon]
MKIGVFSYNFNHKKSYEYLMRLIMEDYNVSCIFAADWVKLNVPRSEIRISPKDIDYIHSKTVADKFSIPYHVIIHNSEECANLIKDYELDVGIILGARILKKYIIDAFKIGIINLHPGVLPYNRGLDNIKWAILDELPQGHTCHLIDERVDWGRILTIKTINVYEDDTLTDLYLRVLNMGELVMIDGLKIIERGEIPPITKTEGKYNSAVPSEIEKDLMKRFEEYKKNYDKILKNWQEKIE